ncbi:TIGR03862 family flavoprotein [Pseudogemmobacter bohemicus]|uniref:TIGR03862 family flavoprotein n=1 Tax=Pseudogemmobacter bohemicus TaxID=2250708 RepID=UPI000DD46750|nr:TIGR03862 family flavoprotein [Pseudogemmobacter bohemicus]
MQDQPDALVIGAGPAGLMAAEELALAGRRVVICEAKPSPARKFLMAGKSGLNLTKDEPAATFAAHYTPPDWLAQMLVEFGPETVKDFARGLGQEVFTGSSGRVFPVVMKGSPLLRAWLARLAGHGVTLRTRWRWTGFSGSGLSFETPEGARVLTPRVTVLAAGGASWARLGSDGGWTPWLSARGVGIAPWQPANMGLSLSWSPHMARHFGQPVKGVRLSAGGLESRGEFVISGRGLEGGGIYPLSRPLREGAALLLDLLPGLSEAEIAARLARMRPGESLANRLRKLGLSPVQAALAMEFGRPEPLARLRRLVIRHDGPRPLDEAISVAGGIRREALTPDLELRPLPGIFACGEMLDWEAPTGGYLLTGCFATGRWAGRAAARIG